MTLPPDRTAPTGRRRLWIFLSLAGAFLIGILAMLALWKTLAPLLDPYRLDPADWTAFREGYVSPEGRVIDTGNGNVSHSEGQGYGMILAEAYGDRKTFEQLWRWTRDQLQVREDALFAWRWQPDGAGGGGVDDPNNASDGDLLIAWALYRASLRWAHPDYEQQALEILADLHKTCFVETPAGYSMLPGQYGFITEPSEETAEPERNDRNEENAEAPEVPEEAEPSPPTFTLNGSYYVFPALDELAVLTLAKEMAELQKGGETLIEKGRFGATELSPDWVTVGPMGYGLPDNHLPAEFGYNAIRIPLHIAWQNPSSPLLEPFVRFWKTFAEPSEIPAVVLLPSGENGPHPALPGMQAVAAFTISCLEGSPLKPRQLPGPVVDEAYYSASLKMLTKLAARESARKGPLLH